MNTKKILSMPLLSVSKVHVGVLMYFVLIYFMMIHVSTLCFHLRSAPTGLIWGGGLIRGVKLELRKWWANLRGLMREGAYRQRNTVCSLYG